MVTISLCMIVKNEEAVLNRCLKSVNDLVDEIIIVDTGSSDETKQIASKYTNKIYDFEWIDDFSAARNFSFSKATMDYIMWLDADDVLLEEDRIKFNKLKKHLDPKVDVVMMKYNLGVDEKTKQSICTYFRERLLKRNLSFVWRDPIHEYLVLTGTIINTDISITHKKERGRSSRNLEIFQKMVAEGKSLSSRNHFYYARELYHNLKIDDAIVYFNKFLEAQEQPISNYIDACIDLSKCYYIKNTHQKALQTLLRSFEYDTPRAEICCEIGYYYKRLKEYPKAIFWFDLATKIIKPEGWGSVMHDCYGYIPNMELCSCYYRLGQIDEAAKYNNKAGEYKPDDPLVTHNKKFLSDMQKERRNS